ncbi:hypothetical protein BT63DRAFT_380170 [Microthyrium microscopicum]|uniref:Secreted protein n=1 Tax=Microthyrium microscopicum TaxID=703497 RepID=A0A6A6TTT3_9PEZI|nr:hypothetical protein BT63DRAFT_380170 [Microthyrium microscopicum]
MTGAQPAPEAEYEIQPPLPPRHQQQTTIASSGPPPAYDDTYFPPPLQKPAEFAAFDQDISSPVHYTRDPHKLIAYLVPFPKPSIHAIKGADTIPDRFLMYTPPPPPLKAPKEGEKEEKFHKVQRKWQEEVRKAKTSDAKVAMGLTELVLVHPASLRHSAEEVRAEFLASMLRTKSKADRDAVLATGLIPVSAAIDLLATPVWPFGGLLEMDGVWAYSSIRGAKTARSVTKRLNSPSPTAGHESELKLTFAPSPRLDVLTRYLTAECVKRDYGLFKSSGPAPTETEVLEALGWAPSGVQGEERNWEDEQWEIQEVKDDLRQTMKKAAREWDKWCLAFDKDPEKALKK